MRDTVFCELLDPLVVERCAVLALGRCRTQDHCTRQPGCPPHLPLRQFCTQVGAQMWSQMLASGNLGTPHTSSFISETGDTTTTPARAAVPIKRDPG